MRDHGFKYEAPKPEDYTFGSGQISADPLVPSGQWDIWLPSDEFQNLYGVEPFACATFGTFNAIEILLSRKYGFKDNFSDRFTAKITGTQHLKGNSPHTVAESIRHDGAVDEHAWPILPAINTFEKFYAPLPLALATTAIGFTRNYVFKHDYVANTPEAMMDALRFSPLGMSVMAWNQLSNGLYQRGTGTDNHWVVCYGYEEGVAWLVFDSYDNSHKRVEWKHRPMTVKRYHIEIAPQVQTLLSRAVAALRACLNWKAPVTPPIQPLPTVTKPTEPREAPPPPLAPGRLFQSFCNGIREHEGWAVPGQTVGGVYYPTGSRSYRNNNPGNTRYSRVGYDPKYGFVGKDTVGVKQGQQPYAIFRDYETGWIYLQNLVKDKIRRHPEWTIEQFIGDTFDGWAPASDNNNVQAYSLFLQKRCAVDSAFRIKNLLQ